MVSSLIRQIMDDGGFRQVDLAERLGVSIDRVKNLTSGRVKKLSSEEMRALVEKLHVRAEFLATGNGPVFAQPAEVELGRRMKLLSDASQKASTLDLPETYQALVRDILVGAALGQSDLLQTTIDGFVHDVRSTPVEADHAKTPRKTTRRKSP
ncbi:helix-turn-helix transcriptional regulator [Stenotrophomonas sp. G106K1]|uniref:helix-turn-helix transcriptional regulator n=1 Tax=Stenotrophomonas sp. G106K1 TaxID=3134792 RepID=UPI0030F3B5FE